MNQQTRRAKGPAPTPITADPVPETLNSKLREDDDIIP